MDQSNEKPTSDLSNEKPTSDLSSEKPISDLSNENEKPSSDLSSEKPTSSKPEPSQDELDAIEELMSAGKRNYVCKEYQLALDCFVDACKQLSIFHGELADECAESYLYYGKTLLEIARLENGVLGHAIKETPVLGEEGEDSEVAKTDDDDEEITDEKRVELRANVEHAMRDGNLYNDSTEDDLTADEDGVQDDEKTKTQEDGSSKPDDAKDGGSSKPDDAMDQTPDTNVTTATQVDNKPTDTAGADNKPTDAAAAGVDSKPGDATGADSKPTDAPGADSTPEDSTGADSSPVDNVEDINVDEDEEEEVSNLQLSWEMFELTCLICKRQLKRGKCGDHVKSHLAEAKYGLAQISLESEHYIEAVNDFTDCLEYYTDILTDKNDRRLAEVNYNIALSLSFDKKFGESIEKYNCAVAILENKIKDLESNVKEAEEKGGKGKASPELEEWKKEINELKDIVLLDMMAKIEDAQEMKKQADESIRAIKEATKEIFSAVGTTNGFDEGFGDGFDQCKNSLEGVHDITNKVRSKRKPEDDVGVESKKIKQTNSDAIAAKENECVAMSES